MMKRLIAIIIATIFACGALWANEEYNIKLDKKDPKGETIELPYGNISFRLVEYGNYHRVLVSIDNTTMSQAMLLFKHGVGEKELKKNKPKIEFEKTYPGSKGSRQVSGCGELNQSFVALMPQDKMDLFGYDVSTMSVTKLEIPVYLAKYDPEKLIKKGAYGINYKILSEDILNFNIEIKGWTENDPDYISTKNAVEEYVRSVESVEFCRNKNHAPSLSQQQKPYQARKDSLVDAINSELQNHPEWFSTDKPHIKYSELLAELKKVDLNARTYDCGKHIRKKVAPGKPRGCSYCSLSAQQIYHQLDDMYQQLRNGKIGKDAAVKRANALYTCYQKHGGKQKDASYAQKISRFYNRIANY